jgi:hypothetical protein
VGGLVGIVIAGGKFGCDAVGELNWRSLPTRLDLPVLVWLFSAFCCAGCVSTATYPAKAVAAGSGAPYCKGSSDGKMVACGAMAPHCQKSSDGKMVACGGQAPFCETSSDGKMVACGGKAPFCQKSSDGKMVACGGASS